MQDYDNYACCNGACMAMHAQCHTCHAHLARVLQWRRYKGGELGGTRADQWSVAGPFTVFYLLFLVLVGTYDSGYYTSKI